MDTEPGDGEVGGEEEVKDKVERHPNSLKNLKQNTDKPPEPDVLDTSDKPDMYAAMCHVLKMHKRTDKTPIQKEARKWLAEDRKGFMSKWADLEKASKVVTLPPSGAEPDGPDSLEDLATQLLADMEGEPWENE